MGKAVATVFREWVGMGVRGVKVVRGGMRTGVVACLLRTHWSQSMLGHFLIASDRGAPRSSIRLSTLTAIAISPA